MTAFRTQTAPAARWNLIAVPVSYVSTGFLVFLLCMGLLIAERRIALGHAAPLPLLTTFFAAVVLCMMTLPIRAICQVCHVPFSTGVASYFPAVILVTWAVACSFPGSQPAAWLIWGAALAFELAIAKKLTMPVDRAIVANPIVSSPLVSVESQGSVDELHPLGEGETVLQHVLRVRDELGHEFVYATLRGEFAPGDRVATLYVGFCPPFASLPNVEVEVIDGAPAVAKVIQSLHNGAQIEVNLDGPSLEATHVTVEVAAFEVQDSGVGSQGNEKAL